MNINVIHESFGKRIEIETKHGAIYNIYINNDDDKIGIITPFGNPIIETIMPCQIEIMSPLPIYLPLN